MKRIVAFSFLSIAGTVTALATDFPPPWQNEPTPVYSTPAPSKSWGGLYLGVNGGYGFGNSQWSLNGALTTPFNLNGALAGGTVGFNFPVSEVLFGLEGDLDWAGFSGNTACGAVNAAGATA